MPLPYCGAKFIGDSPDTVASGLIHSFSKVSCGLSGTRLLTSQGKKQGLKYDFWLKYLKKKGLKSLFFSRTLTKVAAGGGGGSGGDGGGGGQNRGAYLPTSLKGFRAEAACVCWWLWPMGKSTLLSGARIDIILLKNMLLFIVMIVVKSYFNSRIEIVSHCFEFF